MVLWITMEKSMVFAIFRMVHLWLVAKLACRYSAMVVLDASPSLHQAPTLLPVEVMGR